MKKIVSLMLVVAIMCTCFSGASLTMASEENKEMEASFIFSDLELKVLIDRMDHIKGGSYVLTYNPDVVAYSAVVSTDMWTHSVQQSNGRVEIQFEIADNNSSFSSYDPSVLFECISNGTPDFQVEEVCVYDFSGDEYPLTPKMTTDSSIFCIPSVAYEEETATLTISGEGKIPVFRKQGVFVPAPWSDYASTAKKIVFSDGITGISAMNFDGFTMLEQVEIPSSVEQISKFCFPEKQNFEVIGYTLTAAEAYAMENGKIFSPLNEQMIGDINQNGSYEAEDALAILRMAAGLDTVYRYSADASGDGAVNAEDALVVLKKAANLL